MGQLKKTTKFLLVEFMKGSTGKPYYRRAGLRFDAKSPTLVAVDDIDDGRAQQLLSDRKLLCKEMTEKQAEKVRTSLPDEDVATSEDTEKLEAALVKAREQYTAERARVDELELAQGNLLAELEKAESRNDALQKELDELRELLEADDEGDQTDGDDDQAEG